MRYSRDELLELRYHGKGNIIPLITSRQRTNKHHKQLGSNLNNLAYIPVTTFHSSGKHDLFLNKFN